MFVYDDKLENDLATDVEFTKGTVTVEERGCESGDPVRLVFAGTLGSEFAHSPTVTMNDVVEIEIGKRPDLPRRP